jgi:hypothetical protein
VACVGHRHFKAVTLIPRCILLLLCALPAHLWARDPATLFMLECQGCHLSDGSGGMASIPTLQNHVAKFLAAPGGREYLVQVPGVAFSSLSDQDTTAVLNWMLATFGPLEWAQRFPPYTVEEVAAMRKQPLTEITRKRADLLLLIEKSESSAAPGS